MPTVTPTLVTHNGTFHCDDAFAYAILRLALGLGAAGVDHRLIRTRDPTLIGAADIVWDVGAISNPQAQRFDHHQRGAPTRSDTGIPFSAAGLVWQAHGETAVAEVLGRADFGLARRVAQAIDDDVIRRIDAIDNGVAAPGDTLGLSAIVDDCNPAWDSGHMGDEAAEDAAFILAASLMEAFLRRRVGRVRAGIEAENVVLAAHAQAPDPRILELEFKLPWKEAAFTHGLAVLYAVYPVSGGGFYPMPGGNWIVEAMPAKPGSYDQRLPLPESWAGLAGAALVDVTEIADAIFVHSGRFVGASRSRQGALEMAATAIRLGGS